MDVRDRVQLHHAVQLVSAAGNSLLPGRPDFSQTTLEWCGPLSALAGVEQAGGLRAALALPSFELLVVEPGDVPRDARTLDGVTPAAAIAWLGSALGRRLGAEVSLRPPQHSLPPFPGPAFAAPPPGARAEVAALLGAAASLLTEVAGTWRGAGPVRIWPHHFDMASLLKLDAAEGEHARTIGVGMSLGDEIHDGPYLYVTPWPYPKGELPELELGTWNRRGWTGALLALPPGPEMARDQAERGFRFCRGAIEICRHLLA